MAAVDPRQRRPFWMPASNYYMLAVAVGLAFFFITWGLLQEAGEEMPWVTAGIGASIILAGAVILREIILRRARRRTLREQTRLHELDRLHHSVRAARAVFGRGRPQKLTIEQNATILREIRQKSEAAKVLGKFSAGHREVFELCGEYSSILENELRNVNPGSPRLAALLKGRTTAGELHKFHLLKWAEIEARTLADQARTSTSVTDRIAATENALEVIESALGAYPSDARLLQSRDLLRELTVSIKVAQWVEKAERAAFKGDHARAARLYRDALFDLGRDNISTPERENAAKRISEEIEKLQSITNDE